MLLISVVNSSLTHSLCFQVSHLQEFPFSFPYSFLYTPVTREDELCDANILNVLGLAVHPKVWLHKEVFCALEKDVPCHCKGEVSDTHISDVDDLQP